MSKIIKYDNEAKKSIIKGIDTVADIVKTTVGPEGRNVLIRNELSTPIITNDGVTIAKSIELKDNAEDAGAALIISAANKTNEIAGDGTTTTTILAQEMIKQYYDTLDNKVNPVMVQKEMIKASEEISDYLKSIAKPINSTEDIKKVATVSSGDEKIGSLIAKAFEKAGEFGSVIVEDSKTGYDNLVSAEGMKLSIGSVTPYLLNDRINMKSEIVDVKVLVTKDKIDSVTDLLPILDNALQTGIKLLIICDDIEFEPLNMILMNKAKGAPLNLSIIRLPGFGELRENLVEDICLATGATLTGRDVGIPLKEVSFSHYGEIEAATITLDDTIMKFKSDHSNGTNLYKARFDRASQLKNLMNTVKGDDKIQYEKRIANLLSGISVIEVGGNSEVEMKDKKLRIEDALNSVQAAKEEGIVPGGGYSFLKAIENISEKHMKDDSGEMIVYNSLEAVLKQIAENAGEDGEIVLKNCYEKKLGFNALTHTYEDLLEAGVINSVKVDRYSVINATSIASTVITMGGLVVQENEKDQNVLQLQAMPGVPSLM